SCRFACVNGGACVGPDQCECPRNATGSTCADPVCDPPCENGATCSSGNRCLCEAGTSGTRCEKRKCEYRPYQEPYTRGFRRLVSRRYETKCEPWGWKTCVRNQPEYQTMANNDLTCNYAIQITDTAHRIRINCLFINTLNEMSCLLRVRYRLSKKVTNKLKDPNLEKKSKYALKSGKDVHNTAKHTLYRVTQNLRLKFRGTLCNGMRSRGFHFESTITV
ncbi:hypothetical protein C0J52_26161, partial [Blattella germanica]